MLRFQNTGTLDPTEAAHFERLAGQWWNPQGPFWPLHRLNQLRVDYLRGRLCRHFGRPTAPPSRLDGLHLLDVGCGGGLLSEALAQLGADVHAVDAVEKNIQIARLHAKSQSLDIRYEVTTAEALARTGLAYDAVLNMEVVEHVADLPLFLEACSALVRPGGLMFIATINRTLGSWLGAILLGEYLLGWLPRGTHRWRKFPKPCELSDLLSRSGLREVERIGVRINPFTRSFGLSRFTGINYMLTACKPDDPLRTAGEDRPRLAVEASLTGTTHGRNLHGIV